MSEYPEHDKLQKISDESQLQGQFIEWLSGRGVWLGEYAEIKGFRDPQFVPTYRKLDDLLAEYHGIDPAALEREKRAMLAALRAS